MTSPAVFIDRDGTLVYPRHYPTRPEQLRVYEDIGPVLRRLQVAGFRIVVITNQSGLALGLFTEADLERMHAHLRQQLLHDHVEIDGIYYCPHHPEGRIPALTMRCACRKPKPGLLLRAAAELELDLGHSWFVGDILDDVEAGNRAGCHTILVDQGTEAAPQSALRSPDYVAQTTHNALTIIAALHRLRSTPLLHYRPHRWSVADRPETRMPAPYEASMGNDAEGGAHDQQR